MSTLPIPGFKHIFLAAVESVGPAPAPAGFYESIKRIRSSSKAAKSKFSESLRGDYSKAEVGTIKLVAPIKVGDKLCIIGNSTGIKFSKVESIEIKNKAKTKATKGQEIGIKLPLVRKNDEVYKIVKTKKL